MTQAIDTPCGFGAGRPLSLRAFVLTAAAHAVALPLAIDLGNQAIAVPTERLTLVDLAPPAAPPPPLPPAPPAKEPDPRADLLPPPTSATPPPIMALAEPRAALPTQAPAVPAPAKPMPPAAAPPAATAAPMMIASDALDATLVAGRPPRYPHESRRKREQGTVELLVTLGTDGRVEAIALARSSGSPRLDQAALGAVREWRWLPVRKGGQAVRVRGTITIPFLLTHGRKGPIDADCHSKDPDCRSDEGPARDHRRGRMDRRDGDVGNTGEDGET